MGINQCLNRIVGNVKMPGIKLSRGRVGKQAHPKYTVRGTYSASLCIPVVIVPTKYYTTPTDIFENQWPDLRWFVFMFSRYQSYWRFFFESKKEKKGNKNCKTQNLVILFSLFMILAPAPRRWCANRGIATSGKAFGFLTFSKGSLQVNEPMRKPLGITTFSSRSAVIIFHSSGTFAFTMFQRRIKKILSKT